MLLDVKARKSKRRTLLIFCTYAIGPAARFSAVPLPLECVFYDAPIG
jgi:hypothetical protein